jgi:hypothetical protein
LTGVPVGDWRTGCAREETTSSRHGSAGRTRAIRPCCSGLQQRAGPRHHRYGLWPAHLPAGGSSLRGDTAAGRPRSTTDLDHGGRSRPARGRPRAGSDRDGSRRPHPGFGKNVRSIGQPSSSAATPRAFTRPSTDTAPARPPWRGEWPRRSRTCLHPPACAIRRFHPRRSICCALRKRTRHLVCQLRADRGKRTSPCVTRAGGKAGARIRTADLVITPLTSHEVMSISSPTRRPRTGSRIEAAR